jgi:hypothetical protein
MIYRLLHRGTSREVGRGSKGRIGALARRGRYPARGKGGMYGAGGSRRARGGLGVDAGRISRQAGHFPVRKFRRDIV